MKQTNSSGTLLSARSKETRKIIAEIIHKGGASHIGSCYSVVEILDAVYRSVDLDKIKKWSEDRDRIVVSKGHSVAALYATLYNYNLMSKETLLTYAQNNSKLSGHVSHFVKFIEHSTGALGHGLPVATGMAIGLRSRGMAQSKIFVIVGDGEMHEGSNWEALMLAGNLKLSNLIVLVDVNCLCGIGETDKCCSLGDCTQKLESFGFEVHDVDGHDEESLHEKIVSLKDSGKPIAFVCHTIKGKGVSFMEHNNVWHYRPPNKEAYESIVVELAK